MFRIHCVQMGGHRLEKLHVSLFRVSFTQCPNKPKFPEHDNETRQNMGANQKPMSTCVLPIFLSGDFAQVTSIPPPCLRDFLAHNSRL